MPSLANNRRARDDPFSMRTESSFCVTQSSVPSAHVSVYSGLCTDDQPV